MSHSRFLKPGALATAATLVPLAFASTASAAINKQIEYQCKFPLISPGGVTLKLTAPDADVPPNGPIPSGAPLAAQVTLKGATSSLGATLEGAAPLDVDLTVTQDDFEFNIPELIDLPLAKKATSGSPLVLTGTGNVPTVDGFDIKSIFIQGFRLNLIARNAGGTPLQLPPITTDFDGNDWFDSDGDPNTFDVLCRLDPASQDPTIAPISIPVNQAPTVPGNVVATAGNGSVSLTWNASTDSDGSVKEYRVYQDGALVKTVTGTSTSITGLTNGTQYGFQVSAVDNEDREGAKSAASNATPVNTLPTTPGNVVAKPANGSVALTWSASTDSDGSIKSYRVYQDGALVQTVTGTSVTLSGLTNGTQYGFQISAVDNGDAEGAKSAVVNATPANALPTVPGSVTAKPGSGSVALTWSASTDADGTIKEYRVYQGGTLVKTVTGTSTSITGLTNGTQYGFQISAVDNNDAEGAKSAVTNATPVNQAPTVPGSVVAKAGNGSVALTWAASTDADGSIKEYRVYQDGTLVRTVTTLSASITGLTNGKQYSFQIAAVDNEGAEGTKSTASLSTPVNQLPTAPGTPAAVATIGTIALTWAASTDADGTIASYRVYQDGTLVKTVTTPSVTIEGLTNGKQYGFQVSAVDNQGAEGPKSATTNATPKSPEPVLVERSYALSGTALIKTLSKGSLPITGGIDAKLDVATGVIDAGLKLNPTSGRLTALGFLPVTAKIGFAPSGRTVGTLLDGQLNTTSKVRIKVQEVKLFGAIPLAGGNNCQTKSLSEIKLKNTQEFFDYTVGGPIAGTFAISDLNGCGLLNGLVSPLTAGGGNTLNLTLKPAPAPQA